MQIATGLSTQSRCAYAAVALAVLVLMTAVVLGASRGDVIDVQVLAMARAAGLTRVSHEMQRGWLHEGGREQLAIDVEAGHRYMVLAACDVDCLDLRVVIHASDGSVFGSHEDANRPVVSFEPKLTGRYSVDVTMARCRIQPCEWGVKVFRRS